MSELKKCPFCGQLPQITHEKRLISLEFHEGYPNNGRGLYLERDTYNAECTCCALSKSFFSEEEAIAAWNRRAQPENKPLTLDELREMEGEPVWVVTLDGTDEPRWEIIVSAGKCGCGIDLICALNGVETRDYADFDLYNDTWLAYRHKPEGLL